MMSIAPALLSNTAWRMNGGIKDKHISGHQQFRLDERKINSVGKCIHSIEAVETSAFKRSLLKSLSSLVRFIMRGNVVAGAGKLRLSDN